MQKLADINLTSFDTRNVVNMIAMFMNCHSLKDLDLTSFNTAGVTNVQFMFENDYAPTTITVGSGWTMENVQSSSLMFYLDGTLIDQNGTRYQYEYDSTPASYAHIDGGHDNPGLLWGIVDVTLHHLADNSSTLRLYRGHRVHVTYDREFSAIQNSDGTFTSRAFILCLPYEKDLSFYFDAGQIPLYQLAFVGDNHEFTFVCQPPLINAGTPYLLVVEKGTVSLDAKNVKMPPHPNEQIEEDIVYSDFETWGDPSSIVGWRRSTFSTIAGEECTRMHAFAQATYRSSAPTSSPSSIAAPTTTSHASSTSPPAPTTSIPTIGRDCPTSL